MSKILRQGFLVFLLPSLLLPVAVAQDGATDAVGPALGDASSSRPQDSTLRLDLVDAVRLAFENNRDIEVVGYDRAMARESIVAARGAFDPVFFIGTPTGPSLVSRGGGGFGGGAQPPGGIGFADSQEPSTSQLAGADVTESESAALLVDLGQQLPFGLRYDVGYSMSRNVTNSAFTNLNPSYNNTLTFSVVQPLMRGFGREASASELRLAQRDADATAAQFRAQVEAVLLQVEQAYWETVFAERNLAVQEESLELARRQLERTEAQVEVGYIPPVQTTQAEVAVAQRESQLISARNAVDTARDRLRALLGGERLPGGWETAIEATEEPGFEPVDVDVVDAVRRALARRPEVAAARARIAARGVEVDFARNQTLPQLDLVGAVSATGIGGDLLVREGFFGDVIAVEDGGYLDAAEQALSFDFVTWRVGLSLTLPLRNRAAEGNYARATLAEDRARAELERAEQDVVLEVREAARAVESTAEVVEANRKARQLAERQLEIEGERFDVGLATNFEVLEFQEDLSQARTQELRAVIDHRTAIAQLARATGSIVERFGIGLE